MRCGNPQGDPTDGLMPTLCSRVHHGRGPSGFVLLFALLGALLLLLSSLSIHTAVLQSRASEASLGQRAQRYDQLSSAAQVVAGALQRHRCLLVLSLAQWASQGLACITPDQLMALLSGSLPGVDAAAGRYQIQGYEVIEQPLPSGVALAGNLDLRWQPQQGAALQRRFRLDLIAAAGQSLPMLAGVRP